MSAKVLSAAVLGLECELVEVEADTANGLPKMFIVGLPDKAVDESKERVRAALKNSGFFLPHGKITVNLAKIALRLLRCRSEGLKKRCYFPVFDRHIRQGTGGWNQHA